MSRRGMGIVTALVLALLGTVSLVAWVSKAEERALAGEELVEVYVVTAQVASGSPAEELEDLVTVEQVPTKVRADGAVTNLASLAGRVAAVDLLPGEQLVEGRFVERTEFADREVGIEVPGDMVEVTVRLAPERAVGGLIEPGQTVAVFASFEPFRIEAPKIDLQGDTYLVPGAAVASEDAGSTPNTTDLLLRKILVTAVQEQQSSSPTGAVATADFDRLTTSPRDELLVTLAVPPFDAERVVFTAEFGLLWLAVERETVPETADPAKTFGTIWSDQVEAR